MRSTVLIVDDHEPPRRALARELEDADFAVVEAADGEEAWERFQRHAPDVVVTDLMMPRSNGQSLLERIRLRSDVPVILFSAFGSVDRAVTALKAGADDFVSSCDNDVDSLVERVRQALAGRCRVPAPAGMEGRLVGGSPAMRRVRERVASLAPLRTPVLIAGEPGTGRDTVARALHDFGSSAGGQMLRIDCTSPSPETRPGDCSAVYLDAVEALPPQAQGRWLKYLALSEGRPCAGAPRLLASAADPLLEGGDGGFEPALRELLLRFVIVLPPLRDRREDIPALADALVERLAGAMGRSVRLSPASREFLAGQSLPGNARELELLLERAVAFCSGPVIRTDLLQQVLAEAGESLGRVRDRRGRREREALLEALEASGGNITQAAERLGKSRSSVYRLLEKHGLSRS